MYSAPHAHPRRLSAQTYRPGAGTGRPESAGLQERKSSCLEGRGPRNFPLTSGHGFADYLLYVDGKAAGIVEAKKKGVTLIGVQKLLIAA